ncbi:MAG TPA: hypothetical protein VJ866_20185 [Pyrinomonadaceae bacterium]|nr:hypothetical protein [Pyrinomonadaceae bacterium]
MGSELERVYEELSAWCRARGHAGYDPFDALNSRLFRATPLRRSRLARLAWTQLFKRSPVNLRPLALVPAGRNSKGTALFALAALARFRATRSVEDESDARELLADLLAARIETKKATAWGYNFDWQGRAFYAPLGTPTVVPTAFAVRALTEAVAALNTSGEEDTLSNDAWECLKAATSACRFILEELNRSDETEEEVCFSYTPLDRTRVFNASLLAGEALAAAGAITGPRVWTDYALRAARYVVRRQRADGSWAYGADSYQSWADNFHTAFVLTSLARIRRHCAPRLEADAATRDEINGAVERGYQFWRDGFFLADGWPKYYHRSAYPADAHSAGAALVALAELRDSEPDALELARRVARWTLKELYDPRGFFYYQKRRLRTVRTPYMRWSQAWMAYGIARMLEVDGDE